MFRSQSFFLRQTTASAFRYYYISFSISSRDYAQPESILGGYHTAHSSLLANSRVKKKPQQKQNQVKPVTMNIFQDYIQRRLLHTKYERIEHLAFELREKRKKPFQVEI